MLADRIANKLIAVLIGYAEPTVNNAVICSNYVTGWVNLAICLTTGSQVRRMARSANFPNAVFYGIGSACGEVGVACSIVSGFTKSYHFNFHGFLRLE